MMIVMMVLVIDDDDDDQGTWQVIGDGMGGPNLGFRRICELWIGTIWFVKKYMFEVERKWWKRWKWVGSHLCGISRARGNDSAGLQVDILRRTSLPGSNQVQLGPTKAQPGPTKVQAGSTRSQLGSSQVQAGPTSSSQSPRTKLEVELGKMEWKRTNQETRKSSFLRKLGW